MSEFAVLGAEVSAITVLTSNTTTVTARNETYNGALDAAAARRSISSDPGPAPTPRPR